MSLLRAERRRLFKRRFTKYMLLIAVSVLAAVAVGTFFTNQKVGPGAVAAAQRKADRSYQEQLRYFEQQKQDCERSKNTVTPDKQFPQDCAEMRPPSKEEAAAVEWFMPPTFEFKKEFGNMVTVFAAILAMAAFVVGASYVGAEWSTGGMMNLLLWRPNRLQVLLTKLGTLVGALLGLSIVLGGIWTAAFWLIGTYRGSTSNMTPGTWQSFALTGARGVALIIIAGVVGFAVASIGRHTAMAMGLAIGVIVVGQFGLGIALSIAQVRFMEAWLLPIYVQAWIDKKVTLQDWNSCQFSSGECKPKTMEITWHDSALLFSISTAVILAAAMWSMRRRDIT